MKLDEEARAKLTTHAFPGNIRELRNVVQRAILMRTGSTIEAKDILFDAPYLESNKASDSAEAGPTGDNDQYLYLPGRTMAEIEQLVIERSVRRNGGKNSKAAEELKISRSTVIKRMGGGEE